MKLIEIIGWLQITLGVTLAAGLIALLIYLKWDNESGKTISIIFLFLVSSSVLSEQHEYGKARYHCMAFK